MSEPGAEARLKRLFAGAGFVPVEPDILQPAELFIDMIGEDMRRRLFLTTDPEGRELCLRPDFTIPVCLHHISSGESGRRAAYSYYGPAFRYRPDRAGGEFVQAGVESFGRTDTEAADAEILALAQEIAREMGLERPALRLGDPGLFAAFVEALDVPALWAGRLKRHFGRAQSLKDDIRHLARLSPANGRDYSGVLAALEGADPKAARALIEDLLSIAGISSVGGRSAGEIAERFLQQASLAADAQMPTEKVRLLARYFTLDGAPRQALDALAGLARDGGLSLDAALDGVFRRFDRFAEAGIDLDGARFSTGFGRRLDYYTGFVFEMSDPDAADAGHVIGGGRYDRLPRLLGAAEAVPAVGLSVWVERFAGRRS